MSKDTTDLTAEQITQQEADGPDRARRGFAQDVDLDPNSLSGSYFHKLDGGEAVEQGVVVAEVQAGVYLLEVMIEGEPNYQRLAKIDHLVGDQDTEYRFYDTDAHLREAYAALELARLRAEAGVE